MNRRYFLNLPSLSLNILSLGAVFLTGCLGIRIARSPELALKAANVQLNVSGSAKKLKEVSEELEVQATVIEQKDKAYKELLTVYQQNLEGKAGRGKLQRAIKKVESLPEVENIQEVTQQVEEVEEDINLIPVE